ncbi:MULTISPECIES: cytochrome c oxidase subunit II [Kocuria]|uniref:cytochrome-c oxidase n=1 Tax=Kocuria rosea subsp. polaris TaxID=136273 RepID=A0A0W8ILW2_KOCRO|nr:cytochrome c oxidase subunit II [Kocuria polaris]KUG61041.1 cytochrome C oxidase subunit II [Kocuria polaris]
MSSHTRTDSLRRRTAKVSAVAVLAATALTGCSEEAKLGWMPTERGTTDNADMILDLWIGSWIAALAVGLVTWGLMLWCMIAYRRRKYETGYPRQVAYHAPLEVFYTIVPIALIMSLFFFTERTQAEITAQHDNPDVTVQVYGKQWAWDFNYLSEDVWDTGIQGHLDGEEGVPERVPTLYLPVDSEVELQVTSRDVIHSFWVPAFLEKADMFPGRTNNISITTGQEGSYFGKCAEFCGEYHSEMLFNVNVVSQAEYDDHIQSLRDAGQTGALGEEYSRDSYPGTDDVLPVNPLEN